MTSSRNLPERVALVTGGAQGLGLACAERFIAEGARVALVDIAEEKLRQSAARLKAAGGSVLAIVADVRRRADVERMVAETVQEFGRLDVLLNNAGIAVNRDFLAISDEDFDDVLGTNLKGAFMATQTAARQMIAQQPKGGVIINMSSINAILANPALATYAMSKGGMNQLTNTAAIALAPHGIRVVGIGPGTILTEMVEKAILSSDAARHAVLSRTPIGRCGRPDEIASVAAFLASDEASYMTGQTVYPDGGRLALNYTVPVVE